MQLSCILGYNSGDVPYGRLKKPLARSTYHLPLQCRPTYSAGPWAALRMCILMHWWRGFQINFNADARTRLHYVIPFLCSLL